MSRVAGKDALCRVIAKERDRKSAQIRPIAENRGQRRRGFIKNLQNDKLIELCNQRLNNKEASLDELAKKMSENLKVNVSRSNVYHLFKKIKTIADKYRS